MTRRARILGLLLALLGGMAVAAPFSDPTQPPGASAGDGSAAGSAAVEGPRLQSVLIAPNRRVAVIGGQAVALGGMYGAARVIRITETEVVLQTGQERQTLKLHPEVEKRSSRTAVKPGAAQRGARQ